MPVNLFFYGIHVLQIQSEFIIYILITFIMIFFYSLIYLNNLISNSCINRFELKKINLEKSSRVFRTGTSI